METEIAQIELKYQKVNGELLDTNRELMEKLNYVSNILKKTQENSKILHIQFISALNGQKELAEKEIRGRDTYIKQLEEYIKKITEEFTTKLNKEETPSTSS
jgi:rubrerythrin